MIFEDESYTYTSTDFLLTPFFVIFVLVIGLFITNKKIDSNPVYRYYLPGLAIKLFSALVFFAIFTLYYGYGDTIDYIKGSYCMSSLLEKNPAEYFNVFTGIRKWQDAWFSFDSSTTFPPYFMWKDSNTRFVIFITSIFNTISFKGFLPTTILVAFFSYFGVWKLFLFFTDFYPRLTKQMAIAVLFIPSALFWGSGVMKDTYTFAASAWMVYNIYMIFYKKEKIPINVLLGIINAIIIISIKPYIFAALFPGTIIWLSFNRIKKIRNKVLAAFMVPIMVFIGVIIIVIGLSSLEDKLGDYGSFDKAAKKAKVIQEDLLRAEQYGSNSYNVGTIDGTVGGMLKIAPNAIIAGMYRPYLWEARNPVMLISGLENFILLTLTIYLLIKLKFFRFFQFIFSDPILIFSLLFTVFFMFAVGMASANFGALVRYKIPAMPFFVASVFIMLDKYKTYKESKER